MSDQSVAHATSTAQMVATGRRARLTSIQAKGNSASGSIIFNINWQDERLKWDLSQLGSQDKIFISV